VRLVRSVLQTGESEILLYKQEPEDFHYDISFVERVEDADFVLVPQPVRRRDAKLDEYLEEQARFAQTNRKKLLIFAGTDNADRIHIDLPGTVLFKASAYKSDLRANEVVTPTFTPGLAHEYAFTPRQKGERPVVGFCGYAGFSSPLAYLKYHLKNLLTRGVYRRGIYFRRRAIALLKKDPRIETNFIVRDSFGGSTTLAKDPGRERREYLENMQNSDLVLSPKGDGNYSVRFFEALSAGRIPLLIDTDIALPLEGKIDYSKFTLRVPAAELHTLPGRVQALWGRLSEGEYMDMQRAAREAFDTFLRYDKFFNHVL
jgi:hypothetical protein